MHPFPRWFAWSGAFVVAAPTIACSSHNVAPSFGAATIAAVPPPPIYGGTLAVSRDGTLAFASDPDRDHVYIVDLAHRSLRTDIALAHGDEPWRIAEDRTGHIYVSLRGVGAIAMLARNDGTVLARIPVCPEVRGVAYDALRDVVYAACAGGDLVTLPAGGTTPVSTQVVADDLRDVVVEGSHVWLTQFRTANVLDLHADGSTTLVSPQPLVSSFSTSAGTSSTEFDPAVAWRAVAMPSGGLSIVHQRGLLGPVSALAPATSGGYYSASGCAGCSCTAVHATVTFIQAGTTVGAGPPIPAAVLPVDIAVSPDSSRVAIVTPGNADIPAARQLLVFPLGTLAGPSTGCAIDTSNPPQPAGQSTAVAFDTAGNLLVQTREPATLFFASDSTSLPLSSVDVSDTGHAVFHGNSGQFLACASCHPEGGDDGRVWDFGDGGRRTQHLRGGLLATAPFHWDGHLPDMASLMSEVFVSRMGGPTLSPAHIDAVGRWLNAQHAYRGTVRDASAVARGDAIFHDAAVGCAGCHAGAMMTNNATMDVGTGGGFQVPGLRGVALRAPYMHNGCAATLAQRFSLYCGGFGHGQTDQLTSGQQSDLVAYLGSL